MDRPSSRAWRSLPSGARPWAAGAGCHARYRGNARASASLLESITQRFRRRLPVLAVERPNLERGEIDAVDAAHIEHPAAGIEPRARERMDAAVPPEIVLRR